MDRTTHILMMQLSVSDPLHLCLFFPTSQKLSTGFRYWRYLYDLKIAREFPNLVWPHNGVYNLDGC